MHSNDEHWKNLFRIADDVSHSSSNNYELLQVIDKEKQRQREKYQFIEYEKH